MSTAVSPEALKVGEPYLWLQGWLKSLGPSTMSVTWLLGKDCELCVESGKRGGRGCWWQ